MAKTRIVPALDNRTLLIGGAALLGLLWMLNRQSGPYGQTVSYDIGKGIVGGTANAVTDAAAGAVVGIGQAVGVPETNPDACAAAKARGSLWDASFACPAGDFLSYWWKG